MSLREMQELEEENRRLRADLARIVRAYHVCHSRHRDDELTIPPLSECVDDFCRVGKQALESQATVAPMGHPDSFAEKHFNREVSHKNSEGIPYDREGPHV